jgi:O-succinylbenzoate synthase
MTVKDPMSLRSSLYSAAAGAAPRTRSLAEGSQETLARASQGLVAWLDNYFRHTSADRMAVTSLAFWG